jgi:hypothetical protein
LTHQSTKKLDTGPSITSECKKKIAKYSIFGRVPRRATQLDAATAGCVTTEKSKHIRCQAELVVTLLTQSKYQTISHDHNQIKHARFKQSAGAAMGQSRMERERKGRFQLPLQREIALNKDVFQSDVPNCTKLRGNRHQRHQGAKSWCSMTSVGEHKPLTGVHQLMKFLQILGK